MHVTRVPFLFERNIGCGRRASHAAKIMNTYLSLDSRKLHRLNRCVKLRFYVTKHIYGYIQSSKILASAKQLNTILFENQRI